MRTPLPNRQQQRVMIINSIEYKSGSSFNKNDAAAITGLAPDSIVKELSSMCRDRVLAVFQIQKRGGRGRGVTSYTRPAPSISRRSWRLHTNEELGIESSV